MQQKGIALMEFIQWDMKRFALSKNPSGFYVKNRLECGKRNGETKGNYIN